MEQKHKKFLVIFAALAVLCAIVLFATSERADATRHACTETITVVDKEAWTETIEHDAVTETTPAIWANWSPNDTHGPQDYVPVWPNDDRGTWHIHNQLPGGHEGPDGVYQKGGGNSPWFYRQAEKTTVISEAWTETINHPAITHEETVEVECPEVPDECIGQNGEDLCVEEEPPPTTPDTKNDDEDPVNPDIEKPDEPGERITFQAFDGDGKLIEQRVSKPIPAEAVQEGF